MLGHFRERFRPLLHASHDRECERKQLGHDREADVCPNDVAHQANGRIGRFEDLNGDELTRFQHAHGRRDGKIRAHLLNGVHQRIKRAHRERFELRKLSLNQFLYVVGQAIRRPCA